MPVSFPFCLSLTHFLLGTRRSVCRRRKPSKHHHIGSHCRTQSTEILTQDETERGTVARSRTQSNAYQGGWWRLVRGPLVSFGSLQDFQRILAPLGTTGRFVFITRKPQRPTYLCALAARGVPFSCYPPRYAMNDAQMNR